MREEKSKIHKKKILVVEDDVNIAGTVKGILELEGFLFLVDIAKDGAEALEKRKQNRYDVVISDYLMPGMNGEELYLEILKMDQDLAKRIIFYPRVTNDFPKSHGNMFLPKPFNPKELIEAVRGLIS